jgi:hypothetical protein
MKTKKYGFTGTRNGLSEEQKKLLVNILQKDIEEKNIIEVHHGDCVGADKEFHEICERIKSDINIIIHPPTDNKLRAYMESKEIRKEKSYLERNKDIVNETEILLACPLTKTEELRSGTWATIRYAKKQKKKIMIL